MKLDPAIKCESCRLAEARMTVAEAAQLLLLTPERIRQLVRGGMIRQESDGIPLRDAILPYKEFLRERL